MNKQLDVFSQTLIASLGEMQLQWNQPRSGPSSDSDRAVVTCIALMRQAVIDARNKAKGEADEC